jgi:serine/threonine-protein kinase
MRYCTTCMAAFRTDQQRCPNDGGEVVVRADDPLVGHDIGKRYKILKRIAHGGMGVIYRAEHLEMGKHFAVKVLYGDVAADEQNVERFKQEARAASRLDHPNIISITDFDRSDQGILYLVMELLHGEDLYRRVARKGPYDMPRAVSVIRQICRGLGNAHHQGLVHRDLKCENIFLARREETNDFVKILDFGLAHLRDVTTLDGGRSGQSEVGIVFGTPEYMSPEQALGHQAEARSDLYSLGIIFYRLVSGVLPYTAQHPLDVCTQQILDPPRPLRQVRPDITDIPDELEAVIRKLLAKRPEDRPKDAAAVLALLDPFPPYERYGLPSATVVRSAQPFVLAPRDEPGRGRRGVDPRFSHASSELPSEELPGSPHPPMHTAPISPARTSPPGEPLMAMSPPPMPGPPAETSDGALPTFLKLSTQAIQRLAHERAADAPSTAPPTTSSIEVPPRGKNAWIAWAGGIVGTLAAALLIVAVVGGVKLGDLFTSTADHAADTSEPRSATATGAGAAPEIATARAETGTAAPAATAAATATGTLTAAAPETAASPATAAATAGATALAATAASDDGAGSDDGSGSGKRHPRAGPGAAAKAFKSASACVKSAAARVGVSASDLAFDPEIGPLVRSAAADARSGAWGPAGAAEARACDALARFDFNRKFLAAKLSAAGAAVDALEAKSGAAAAAPLRARWNEVVAAMPSSLGSAAARKAVYGKLAAIASAAKAP